MGGAPLEVQCQVDSSSGKRLTLTTPERVAVSTAVSLEYNDSMLLCEVVACTQDVEQRWHLELHVEQILTGLQSLITLRERLLGESAPSRMNSAAVGAHRG